MFRLMYMPLKIVKKSDLEVNAPSFSIDKRLDDDIKWKIPYPMPSKSFYLNIVGKPSSGKSSMWISSITSLNKRYRIYRGVFDRIYIFIPQTSYKSVENLFERHTEDRIYHELTQETLEELHEELEENANENLTSLVIIDDFSAYLKDAEIEKILFKINTNRRHIMTSIIIIQHTLLNIQPRLRKQASHLILFKTTNAKEINAFNELINLDKNELKELFEFVYPKDEKYNFLLLDVDKQKDGLFKKFNKIEYE